MVHSFLWVLIVSSFFHFLLDEVKKDIRPKIQLPPIPNKHSQSVYHPDNKSLSIIAYPLVWRRLEVISPQG